MSRLDGKVAIITGASGGIGSATAAAFVREGARVLLVGRDHGRIAAVAATLGHDDRVATHVADGAIEAEARGTVAAAVARFGGVDILFANAGAEGSVTPLTALTVEAFDAVQTANVRGTWLMFKHVVPAMIARSGGAIVATSSVAGVVGVPGLAAYVASKHAIIGLVKVAALELATAGIRVNAVLPAPIDNAMMRSIEAQAAPGQLEAARAGFAALNAMKRYGTNDEVARMVLFLASSEASFCTGGSYLVDGGLTAA